MISEVSICKRTACPTTSRADQKKRSECPLGVPQSPYIMDIIDGFHTWNFGELLRQQPNRVIEWPCRPLAEENVRCARGINDFLIKHTHMHTWPHIRILTHIHTFIYTHTHVYTHAQMCIYIYLHIHSESHFHLLSFFRSINHSTKCTC